MAKLNLTNLATVNRKINELSELHKALKALSDPNLLSVRIEIMVEEHGGTTVQKVISVELQPDSEGLQGLRNGLSERAQSMRATLLRDYDIEIKAGERVSKPLPETEIIPTVFEG